MRGGVAGGAAAPSTCSARRRASLYRERLCAILARDGFLAAQTHKNGIYCFPFFRVYSLPAYGPGSIRSGVVMQSIQKPNPQIIPPGPVTGLHVIADLYGCPRAKILTDATLLEEVCINFVREAGLFDVGRLFHAFPEGGGVTGVVVLAESHLSVHTWPENGYVSIDVFVCNYTEDNTGKARALAARLIDRLSPTHHRLQEVQR